MMFLF